MWESQLCETTEGTEYLEPPSTGSSCSMNPLGHIQGSFMLPLLEVQIRKLSGPAENWERPWAPQLGSGVGHDVSVCMKQQLGFRCYATSEFLKSQDLNSLFFFFHLYRWNHLQFTSGAQCSLFSEIWLWFQLWGKTASWLKRNFSVWSIFCIQTWFYWDLKVSALRVLPSAGVQCSGLKAVPSFLENKNKTPAIRRTISVTQVHALCNMKVHNLYWSFI